MGFLLQIVIRLSLCDYRNNRSSISSDTPSLTEKDWNEDAFQSLLNKNVMADEALSLGPSNASNGEQQ